MVSTCSTSCNCTSATCGNDYYDGTSTAPSNTCGCCGEYGYARIESVSDLEEREEVIKEIWEALRIIFYIIPPLKSYIECKARAPPFIPVIL